MTQFEKNLAECYQYVRALNASVYAIPTFKIANCNALYFQVKKQGNTYEFPLFLYGSWKVFKSNYNNLSSDRLIMRASFNKDNPITISANTSLLTYMNNKYRADYNLVCLKLGDKFFYVAPGLILDENLNILFMYTIKVPTGDITVYINNSLYKNSDTFSKMLTGKAFSYLAVNSVSTEDFGFTIPKIVVSDDINEFLVLPNKELKKDSIDEFEAKCNKLIRENFMTAFNLKYPSAQD